jgi:hypothetical protein
MARAWTRFKTAEAACSMPMSPTVRTATVTIVLGNTVKVIV